MKQKKKITENYFLLGFIAITFLLALIKLLSPSIVHDRMKVLSRVDSDSTYVMERVDSARTKAQSTPSSIEMSHFFTSDNSQKKSRIVGVRDYEESFPGSQPQQPKTALHCGVKPVADRADAEKCKNELVYTGSNLYYNMKKSNSSIPYLVSRAAILLRDTVHNFMGSLQTEGILINKLLVPSVLRTKEGVEKPRWHNHDAMENGRHLCGTTFDIVYNKYVSVTHPMANDTLKWVLSEVLNDLRLQGRCSTKHKEHQGCSYIIVR